MAFLTTSWRGVTRRAARGFVVLALLWAAGAQAAAPSAEYQVKAIFLFNFAQFVEWPPQTLRDPRAPLVIGVLGDDPFGSYLDETVRSEKIGDHPMVVRRYHELAEVTDCQVLFISRSEATQMRQLVAGLKGRSVLTVGDVDDFNRVGGIIRFATEQGRIRLKINVAAAQAAGITISSKLLRSATIVAADNE
jgi:hypothetical protein